ncbi:MAG TPA: hypothetical protein VFZ21_19645 [Gemmatimonadaceae bacterium]|jgi:transposase|nr:hypothetical protein [Gemmatimonadaceae bacterium]
MRAPELVGSSYAAAVIARPARARGRRRRAREGGSPAARPHTGGGRPKVDAADGAVLRALVEERNDRTLAELAALYGHRTGVAVSIHAIHRACGRLDLRRKKRSLVPSEQAREDVATARAARPEARAAEAPAAWYSSTRAASRPTRRATTAARPGGSGPCGRRRTADGSA